MSVQSALWSRLLVTRPAFCLWLPAVRDVTLTLMLKLVDKMRCFRKRSTLPFLGFLIAFVLFLNLYMDDRYVLVRSLTLEHDSHCFLESAFAPVMYLIWSTCTLLECFYYINLQLHRMEANIVLLLHYIYNYSYKWLYTSFD